MQITSRFTIAVHMITVIDYVDGKMPVTSRFLADSIGANPVIIRNVMGQLKEAGLILSSQGKSGIALARPVSEITFYDIYKAVDCVDETGLFHFHENPSMDCPVGRNIHGAMDERLQDIQQTMEEEMKQISLADVVSDVRKANT
ncbi:MAG: Rrf2 family transcriptional regulator [Clostridia bacterium]|nr:Rrf2 family transcriptional regulator [Clostridia bacterium]